MVKKMLQTTKSIIRLKYFDCKYQFTISSMYLCTAKIQMTPDSLHIHIPLLCQKIHP